MPDVDGVVLNVRIYDGKEPRICQGAYIYLGAPIARLDDADALYLTQFTTDGTGTLLAVP